MWAKVDPHWAFSPQVMRVSFEARGLILSIISWLANWPNETSVPEHVITFIAYECDHVHELIEELEDAGAWFYDDDLQGWVLEPHWGIPAALRERGPVDEVSLLKRDGWSCAHCGATCAALQVDHIVPFSDGGSDTLRNLQWLCPPCNMSKGVHRMDEWQSSDNGTAILANDCARGQCGHESSARLRRLKGVV